MTKEQLLSTARELVNTTPIKGYSAAPLKVAANNDIKKFAQYLINIAEQANDPASIKNTIETYTQDLVDIAILFAQANNTINEIKIKGGNADNVLLSDIAKKFNIELNKIKKELNMGIEVEMEHTKNKEIAKDIAMDHLFEIPDYYTRLKKMEKDGNIKWSKKEIKEALRRGIANILK